MEILSVLVLWLHVTAAAIWIGGNFMIAMVIVPYFKRSMPPVERIKIMTQIGRSFEPIGWACVVILIFSGLVNIFTAGVLASPDLIGPFMRMLGIKLLLVLILIILTGIHGFIMAPRLTHAVEELEPGTEELPNISTRCAVRWRWCLVLSVCFPCLLCLLRLRCGWEYKH